MIGILGLGLGCWTTGALSQPAGLSEADFVDNPQAEAEANANMLQARPSTQALASARSAKFAFEDVPALSLPPQEISKVRKK
jgi:hypothetical protein